MTDILVKTLQLPLPPSTTEALGIHQSDVILRSALIAAIADMRANPWLLDYVFASLPRDDLTLRDYGEREVGQAKKWFLATDIPVFMNYRLADVTFPCISISLQESTESEVTLGDVHYQPSESAAAAWPILAGPFAPASYSRATGTMTLPAEVATTFSVAEGMLVIDTTGGVHPVLRVLDDSTFTILAGTVADFSSTIIKPGRPMLATQLESLAFREIYQIGCHAHGEPFYLTYLHSIVVFALLRYKEVLLEARGLERTTISSSQFLKNDNFENELVFSRFITLTGFVRNYWPKAISSVIQTVKAPVSLSEAFFDQDALAAVDK